MYVRDGLLACYFRTKSRGGVNDGPRLASRTISNGFSSCFDLRSSCRVFRMEVENAFEQANSFLAPVLRHGNTR